MQLQTRQKLLRHMLDCFTWLLYVYYEDTLFWAQIKIKNFSLHFLLGWAVPTLHCKAHLNLTILLFFLNKAINKIRFTHNIKISLFVNCHIFCLWYIYSHGILSIYNFNENVMTQLLLDLLAGFMHLLPLPAFLNNRIYFLFQLPGFVK